MITIIQQPTTNKLMAAYRPCTSKVDFSNNAVPMYFNITVPIASSVASFAVTDDTVFFLPGWTTFTIGNAGTLNGTYNIFSLGSTFPPLRIQLQATVTLPAGNYPNATITLNSTLIEDTALNGPPKVVYCDVYINNTYYKTIHKTQPISQTLTDARFEFDIQDALQEYLSKPVPVNGGSTNIVNTINAVYCKYRSSSFDVNKFLVPDPTIPIQATGKQPAVAGTGTQGNTFFVVNGTLQHEDNQDLATHLNAFKNGTWAAGMYPLTHRPNGYKLCRTDSDYFPLICIGQTPTCLRLNYRLRKSSVFQSTTNCPPPVSGNTLIFKWKIDESLNMDLTGRINGAFSDIDWGDGIITSSLNHTYAATGDYTVHVYNSTSTIFDFQDGTGLSHWNISEVIQLIPTIERIIVGQSLDTVDAIEYLPTAGLANLQVLKTTSNQLNVFPDLTAATGLTEIQISFTALPSTAVDLSANTALEQITLNIPNMISFAGVLTNCKYFEAIGAQLSVANINNILVDLDANGIVYVPAGFSVSCYLFSQVPAAPPSGAGITAKMNLLTKGWTVNTD